MSQVVAMLMKGRLQLVNKSLLKRRERATNRTSKHNGTPIFFIRDQVCLTTNDKSPLMESLKFKSGFTLESLVGLLLLLLVVLLVVVAGEDNVSSMHLATMKQLDQHNRLRHRNIHMNGDKTLRGM